MKQYVGNACGTIATLHSIANAGPIRDTLAEDSPIRKFFGECEGKNQEQRGHVLEEADYLSEASAVFVLTGGIKKNILGDWQPSEATLERVLVGNKVANDISIPLIISGGRTSTETESEAFIVRNHFK